jgi:hypothetical protein
MSLNAQVVAQLQTSIEGLVQRIMAQAGLSEAEVLALVTGKFASDAVASAGASTTDIATIRGAYLAAQKQLGDVLGQNAAGYQTLADLATKIATNTTDIDSIETLLAGLANAFNYVGIVDGMPENSPFDLSTLPAGGKNAGDYYKVGVTGHFVVGGLGAVFKAEAGDGLVFNLQGGVDIIDNTVGRVAGTTDEITVTGSAETGFVVAVAETFKARLAALESVVVSLAKFGVLAAVEYAALLPNVVLATVNALDVGTYNVQATAAGMGIDSGLVAVGSTPVVGTVKVVEVAAGKKQVHLTVVVEGRALTKTIKGDVADGANATVIGWVDSQADINSVLTTLTSIFNAQIPA